MKTKALRLYGKNDLRLDEYELPAIRPGEILARVVSDSICMSSYKAAIQGGDHKRVPDNCAENPIIIGHELCGEIVEVGAKWADKFKSGQKFAIQPAFNFTGVADGKQYTGIEACGYSFSNCGGDATYIILPEFAIETGCILPYSGDSFYAGSLAEAYSCVAGGFHGMYHTRRGSYAHIMNNKTGGTMAILAGVGPMGLAAIDYIIHCDHSPRLLVVTDIDDVRLARAARILSVEEAAKNGVELIYKNTRSGDPVAELRALTDGKGFDDVMLFAPVSAVAAQADAILGTDGCLNCFAGPADTQFSGMINLYNVHYANTHIMATAGGNNDDLEEVLDMMSAGKLNPAYLVTHIGGLNAAREATLNLPKIPGGKKLIYTGIDLPLTALADFEKLGETDPMFAKLHTLTEKTHGLWNPEAEAYLLQCLETK